MKIRIACMFILAITLLSACKTTGSNSSDKVLRVIPRDERVALMVLNFKNTTVQDKASEYQPWEVGIPSMIMTDLESIGIFNILSWESMKDILEQQAFQSYGIVDEKEAVEIGKVVAAKYILSGTYMIMNGTLRIEAKAYSVKYGTLIGASTVTGDLSHFFDLHKKLVIEMTSYLGAMLTSDETKWLESNIETRSIDASLDNYAGEMALMKAEEFKAKGNKYEEAEKLIQLAKKRFENALKYDPSYRRAKKNLASITMALPMTL